jgi:hypothetical protein
MAQGMERDMEISYIRYLVCFLVLWVAPACLAQAVTIRVINAADGHPLQKQQISVTFFYDKGEKRPAKYEATLSLETNVNGEAQFTFPEPAPAHLAAQVRIDWGRWKCGCGVLAATEDLIQKGIVESAATPKKSPVPVKAVPGEILFVARPLSFFERLLYPFVKG